MMAGNPTAAIARAVSTRLGIRGLILAGRDLAITAIARSEGFERTAVFIFIKIRPVFGRDVQFRVGSLPDHEITHPQLARWADDQIRVWDTRCIEIAVDERFVYILRRDAIFYDILDCIDNFIAPAIVEGNVQYELVVVFGHFYGIQHFFL